LSLLAICEERQCPAGIYLHCQVLMLDQFHQGRKRLWTKSRGEGGCGGGGVETEDEGNGRREKKEGKREQGGKGGWRSA